MKNRQMSANEVAEMAKLDAANREVLSRMSDPHFHATLAVIGEVRASWKRSVLGRTESAAKFLLMPSLLEGKDLAGLTLSAASFLLIPSLLEGKD